MKTVYVGLSGGVDSSVTAALLKEQEYRVVGIYMKNWTKSLPGFRCPWEQDLRDAKRIAVQLGIAFEIFDFEDEYFDKVVQYMIDGFKAGLTPNPDIMCNQEIKFRLFFDVCMQKGADYVATGHYAQVDSAGTETRLRAAKDPGKDQTYFLYRTKRAELEKTLFPLGNMHKTEVRKKAKELGLVTAEKKDSVGICFVGEIGIKDFLKNYVEYEPGPIINQRGEQVGEHEGAIFYTIGQRSGMDVGGGLPYYVTGKDMTANTVFVSSDINDDKLWSSSVTLSELSWVGEAPQADITYTARIRHLGELHSCTIDITDDQAVVRFDEPVRAVTPGQSLVVYNDDICLGGGIISER